MCDFKLYLIFTTVIKEPDDVTVCEGKEVVFTCVLGSSVGDDIQWYRLINNPSIIETIDPNDDNISLTTSTSENTISNQLTITNARKSHTGYYWVVTASDTVCNASLTVLASMDIAIIYVNNTFIHLKHYDTLNKVYTYICNCDWICENRP